MKISHSEVRTFKECRRKYFFRYVERLVPIQTAEALAVGSEFHDKVAQVLKKGFFEPTGEKTDAMVVAWQKYVMPVIHFKNNPEQFFKIQLREDIELIGFVDGECIDGLQVEHKTTGYSIDDKYIHRLAWDEQIPTYLLCSGNTDMWYTVIEKPTIRQTQKETLEQYLDRCVAWYDTDTEQKVRVFRVHRQREELEQHRENLILIADEISTCKNYYRNPSACSIMSCPYSSICLDYDPEMILGFEKKEGRGPNGNPDTESV